MGRIIWSCDDDPGFLDVKVVHCASRYDVLRRNHSTYVLATNIGVPKRMDQQLMSDCLHGAPARSPDTWLISLPMWLDRKGDVNTLYLSWSYLPIDIKIQVHSVPSKF